MGKLSCLEEQKEKAGDSASGCRTAHTKEKVRKAMPRIHRKSPSTPERNTSSTAPASQHP